MAFQPLKIEQSSLVDFLRIDDGALVVRQVFCGPCRWRRAISLAEAMTTLTPAIPASGGVTLTILARSNCLVVHSVDNHLTAPVSTFTGESDCESRFKPHLFSP